MESIDVNIAELGGPEQLAFRSEALRLEPGAGQVAARTLTTAISPGTELAAWSGAPPLRPGNPYPRLVGYCNVAEVQRVGDGVPDLRQGDRIYTHQSHRSAFVCDASAVLAKVPPAVDSVAAATTYLYHLGYDALMRGGCRAGSRVAVLGLGTLGLTTVTMARVAGAEAVAVTGQRGRDDLARAVGAGRVLAKDVDDATLEGVQADIVVTTAGSWSDWRLALRLPRRGGTIVALGFPGREEGAPDFNPLDSQFFYDRQLTIAACGLTSNLAAAAHEMRFNLSRNCAYILRLIETGAVDPARIVTTECRWDELEEVYRRLAARDPEQVTAVLRWQ